MSNGVVLSGVCFNPEDFNNYGWLDSITVNGTSYIRILGLFAAAMSDIGVGLVTTATSTHNLGTMVVGNPVTVTLATNRPYRVGAHVLIANDSTHYFQLIATADCTTTSLTGTIEIIVGTGSLSAWDVSITGAQGATGAGAFTYAGRLTAPTTLGAGTLNILASGCIFNLPTSPTAGAQVQICIASGKPAGINPAPYNINSSSAVLYPDPGQTFTLTFDSTANDWE